jgi:hypothetical protein
MQGMFRHDTEHGFSYIFMLSQLPPHVDAALVVKRIAKYGSE